MLFISTTGKLVKRICSFPSSAEGDTTEPYFFSNSTHMELLGRLRDAYTSRTSKLPKATTFRDIPALLQAGLDGPYGETRVQIQQAGGDELKALLQIERHFGGIASKIPAVGEGGENAEPPEEELANPDAGLDQATAMMVADYRSLLTAGCLTQGPPLDTPPLPARSA